MRLARAQFSTNLASDVPDAEIIDNLGFDTLGRRKGGYGERCRRLVVLCSSDDVRYNDSANTCM